jgi:hypothetical protein
MKLCLVSIVLAALIGCASKPILVFGQSHTVGLTIGGSTIDQRAELSLGYQDYDIAVVPVEVLSEAPNDTGGVHKDSLSVLGQFELDAGTNGAQPNVGLGKFFATGLAAKTLADGFRCKLSSGQHAECTQH